MSYQQAAKSLRWLAFNSPEVHPADNTEFEGSVKCG